MSAIQVLIVEDEFIIAQNIKSALKKIGYEIAGHAFDFPQAIELLKNNPPDIVMLDITLDGEKDGIELAEYINKNHALPFIFLTSHSDPITLERAKATHPAGYLVKPFEKKDIYAAIEIALANYAKSTPSGEQSLQDLESISVNEENLLINNALFIKSKGYYVKVKVDDIFWIKSDRMYVEVHTSSKVYLVRSSLVDFMSLLDSSIFFRVHRSFAVNLNQIEAINAAHILILEEQIPIGRSYKEDLISRLKRVN